MIDFTQALKDLDGKPIVDANVPEQPPLTLARAATMALIQDLVGETPSAEDKDRRFRLASRIFNDKQIALSPEEAALIKDRVAKTWAGVIVYGRVCELLDAVALENAVRKQRKR